MSDQPSYQLASPRGPLRQSRASRASSVSLRSERWSKTSEDPQLLLDAAVAATELRDGVSVLSDAQLRVAWCAATMSGVYPGQAHENQDRFVARNYTVAEDGSKAALFGVFDGHGASGHTVAQFVCDRLAEGLRSVADTEAIIESFQRVDDLLEAEPDVPSVTSGTTACVLAIDAEDGVARVASLGDSRALLGSLDGGSSLAAEQLSDDHTPADYEEYKRCKASGARIMTMPQLRGLEPWADSWEKDRGSDDDAEEKLRIFARDRDMPGCTLTRGFGDSMAKSLGMIATPEMKTVPLTAADRYIILATDGIFDALSNERVLELARQHGEGPGGSPREAPFAERGAAENRRFSQHEL